VIFFGGGGGVAGNSKACGPSLPFSSHHAHHRYNEYKKIMSGFHHSVAVLPFCHSLYENSVRITSKEL